MEMTDLSLVIAEKESNLISLKERVEEGVRPKLRAPPLSVTTSQYRRPVSKFLSFNTKE